VPLIDHLLAKVSGHEQSAEVNQAVRQSLQARANLLAEHVADHDNQNRQYKAPK